MLEICESPIDFSLPDYLTCTNADPASCDYVSLSDYTGKVILLSFMCIRCGWCWNWIQHMQQIQNDYETNPDVQIVGVIYNYNDDSDGIHSGPVTKDWIDEKLASYGISISFPLLMDGPWIGSVSQQYLGGFSGWVGFPWSFVVSSNFLITNKWHRLSTTNGEPICFDSGDMDDSEYFVRHRLDDLQDDRLAWDTVLVLDYSGSMNTSVTIGGVTQPKIDFLREAASTLLKVWKDYALCEDRIGLVYFKNHAYTDGSLIPILPGSNVESAIGDIESQIADDCTAMGAGLATGLDILETSPHSRFVILFSDGMQNRNPLVYVAEIHHDGVVCLERHIDNIGPADYPDSLTTLCGPDGGQSDYSGTLPVVLEGIDVPIHTIGIGAYGSWLDMLNQISLASFGQFNTAEAIWPDLKEFFLETLVELYRGSSLQVVAKMYETLDDTQQVLTFHLNKSVKKATVILSWLGKENPLTFKLRKDGHPISLRHKVVNDQTYCFATIAFPHYQKVRTIFQTFGLKHTHPSALAPTELYQPSLFTTHHGESIRPDGNWEIFIEKIFPDEQTSVPFHLMVLADDTMLEYTFDFPKEILYTGEVIPLAIKVLENGKPIEKLYSAEVVIHRPTVALGNILSKYKIKGTYPKAEGTTEDFYPVAQKLELLMQDKEVVESLKKVERDSLNLQPSWKTKKEKRKGAKGKYSGFFNNTSVPGVYRLDFKIKGVGNQSGIFERIESRTVIVKSRPDRKATELTGIYKERDKRALVTFAPTDKSGNLLGPGYSQLIQCTVKGKPLGKVTDKLDGSYQIELRVPSKEDLKRIKVDICILGEKIFDGILGTLLGSSKGDIKKS